MRRHTAGPARRSKLVCYEPASRCYFVVKRILDVTVATIALVCCAPLVAGIGWLIKREDGGAVFYRQWRIGHCGQPFLLLKFRTMRPNAPDIRNPDGSTFAAATDARVTRVGRLLRAASLDEVPQLWNVIAGHLSLVGPRPDLVDQIQFYGPADYERLSVKPGITGWAQINGRNNLPWRRRRELDREYVGRRGLLLDLLIIARTVPLVLRRRGVFADAPGRSSAQ